MTSTNLAEGLFDLERWLNAYFYGRDKRPGNMGVALLYHEDSVRQLAALYEARIQSLEAEREKWGPVLCELQKATTKFPTWPTDPLHAVSVLGEEYGELVKEVLQSVYEPHKSSPEAVSKEALQCAAMALRFYASLGKYEYKPQPQHSQESV